MGRIKSSSEACRSAAGWVAGRVWGSWGAQPVVSEGWWQWCHHHQHLHHLLGLVYSRCHDESLCVKSHPVLTWSGSEWPKVIQKGQSGDSKPSPTDSHHSYFWSLSHKVHVFPFSYLTSTPKVQGLAQTKPILCVTRMMWWCFPPWTPESVIVCFTYWVHLVCQTTTTATATKEDPSLCVWLCDSPSLYLETSWRFTHLSTIISHPCTEHTTVLCFMAVVFYLNDK